MPLYCKGSSSRVLVGYPEVGVSNDSMVIALYVREAPNMCVMRMLRMRGNLRRGSSMLKAGICGVDVIYT